MIIEMRKATDENYVNFCITVFKVISEMDGDKIRDYLNLRVKANMDLPEMIRDRDLKMMEKALAAAPDDVIQKISKYMPNFLNFFKIIILMDKQIKLFHIDNIYPALLNSFL
ncbi:hypothetical protein [Acidiplasma cupricumulans]|uniref:hypothetical protein n=1 Tax=Acidiplasma cupricumulans TaxID=312540 RepID=UPI001584B3F3|nr:hypothetical protein [Acidiplasma cupricumulans]